MGLSYFFGIWVQGCHPKVSTNGFLYVPMDSPHSMFFARMLSFVDTAEMKMGHHCVDLIDYEGDYI